MGAHVLNYGHLSGSPYTPPQSRVLPPPLEISKLSLFQSPSAKTVGSQCPSPESIRGTTPQSQPCQSNSERECDSDRIEHTASTEESESPLGDLSHLEARATPQKKNFFSTPAPTPSDSSDGTVAVTGARKRKRTPRGRTQDPKKKPAKETKMTKNGLEGGVERKGEVGGKGMNEEQKEQVEVQQVRKEKSVSAGDSNTVTQEGIKEQSTASKPPPQSTVDESVPKSPSESSPSSPFILGIDSSNQSNVLDSALSPQSPPAKKRKLSKSAEISGGTVATKGGSKQTMLKKKTKKAASKARTPPGDDTDSGWATTADESEGEVVKEKKAPSSKGKRLKAVAVERVSKSTTLKENPDKKPDEIPASTINDSSSEWETDADNDTENTAPVEPATSVSSATQNSLDRSQKNNNTKAAKPRKKPKPVAKEATPADSSSGWTTDEDEAEMDSKSQVEDRASQPSKKKDSKVTKGLEKIANSTSGDKRKTEGRNSGKSNKKEKKKGKSSSESEKSGSQSEKLVETWNQFTSPSPVKRYSAQDGRRLRQKKLEDLKHCSKVSEVTENVTADNTGSVSGSNESAAGTFARRVEETAVNLDPVEKDREEENDRHEGGENVYIDGYVEASGSSRETEVLAPNSLPSDEEMELETFSKSHGETLLSQSTFLA